jgi:hypothetical protein
VVGQGGWHVALLALAVFAAGCASAPPAESRRATAEAEAIRRIDSIALLPVVFPGNTQDPRLTKVVFDALTLRLAEKGHVLERAETFVGATEATLHHLKGASAERLAALLPASADYFLLCWIDDLSKEESILKDSATARLSAALIDRPNKRILWSNAITKTGTNYLWNFSTGFTVTVLRRLYDESTQLDVLKASFRELLAPFPEKPMR